MLAIYVQYIIERQKFSCFKERDNRVSDLFLGDNLRSNGSRSATLAALQAPGDCNGDDVMCPGDEIMPATHRHRMSCLLYDEHKMTGCSSRQHGWKNI